MSWKSFSHFCNILDKKLRITIGNIQADKPDSWNTLQDVTQTLKISFGRSGRGCHIWQDVLVGGRESLPFLNAVVLVNTSITTMLKSRKNYENRICFFWVIFSVLPDQVLLPSQKFPQCPYWKQLWVHHDGPVWSFGI
jgi:hypothetical protein